MVEFRKCQGAPEGSGDTRNSADAGELIAIVCCVCVPFLWQNGSKYFVFLFGSRCEMLLYINQLEKDKYHQKYNDISIKIFLRSYVKTKWEI